MLLVRKDDPPVEDFASPFPSGADVLLSCIMGITKMTGRQGGAS